MNLIQKFKSIFIPKAEKDDETEEASVSQSTSFDPNYKDTVWTENSKPEIGSFNAVVVADGHGHITPDLLGDINVIPDVFFLLGDNDYDDIEAIKAFLDEYRYNVPVFGVEGNHDDRGLLKECGIDDLNGRVIEWNGFRIGGISGSIRYKEAGNRFMISNGESEAIADALPLCDILLTHSNPCFQYPDFLTPHSGLTGIGNYIREKQPKIVLHGHLHDQFVKSYQSTIVRCCWSVECIKISI